MKNDKCRHKKNAVAIKNKKHAKNLLFYSEETKSVKKRINNLVILNCYLNYHFFLKNLKN